MWIGTGDLGGLGGITKAPLEGPKNTFWGDRYAHFDYCDGFIMNVYRSKAMHLKILLKINNSLIKKI